MAKPLSEAVTFDEKIDWLTVNISELVSGAIEVTEEVLELGRKALANAIDLKGLADIIKENDNRNPFDPKNQ